MSTGRIPLTRLYERTSARGNCYLYGCLGYARVLGFPRETEDCGGVVWGLFVVEPPASGRYDKRVASYAGFIAPAAIRTWL